MFEYFPGNYVWNLGVVATLNSGGLIDEVDRACRPIRDLAAQGSDVGTAEFMASWAAVAEDLAAQAAADGEGRAPALGRAEVPPRDQLPRPGGADAAGRRSRPQRGLPALPGAAAEGRST